MMLSVAPYDDVFDDEHNVNGGDSIDAVNCSDFTIDLEEEGDDVSLPAVPDYFGTSSSVGDHNSADHSNYNVDRSVFDDHNEV